jgi:hypothetical protein
MQVALPGVGPALGVRVPVFGEEPVDHRGVARGEVAVDPRLVHPQVERAGGFRIGANRLLLERPLVLVGLRPQPGAELADLHDPELVGGHRRFRGFSGLAAARFLRNWRGPEPGHGGGPERALQRSLGCGIWAA